MYKYQVKKYVLFGVMITLGLCSYVFGFDLTSEISDKFKGIYDGGFLDEYLDVPYGPTYSKDPFKDALSVYTGMSAETRVAGVKYVENVLELNNCSLSKEKQWAILYYFVPEYRSEIARTMKIDGDDYDSQKYTFDEEVILDYCTEFYNCITSKSDLVGDGGNKTITSSTPENIETNCKEFFQINYREGQAEKKRIQNLQISWLGSDKYLNAIVKESPFDVMGDLGTIGELSYLQSQMPITPVFYNLLVFSGSREALLQRKNGGGDNEELVYRGSSPLDPTKDDSNINPTNSKQITTNTNPSVQPLSSAKVLTIQGYDSLVEGLGALSLNNDNSSYYGSLCKDEEEEPDVKSTQEGRTSIENVEDFGGDMLDLTKEEYQEMVDYMYEAVNSYISLSDEKLKEIERKAGSLNIPNTSDNIEDTAKSILGCYKSCDGLSVDEQFLCILKCSCKETKSPIFDPEVTPGMGPIYVIRYCAVASANPRYFYEGSVGTDSWSSTMKTSGGTSSSKKGSSGKGGSSNGGGNGGGNGGSEGGKDASKGSILNGFNKGGITMVSMEKGINEIFGVTDKLSREGRLGVWTPQRNHLDSSTDLVNAYDSMSFTLDADTKKVSDQVGEPTDEYMQRYMKTRDENRMVDNHVANPLDNPATKNRFRLVSYQGELVSDVSLSANADVARQAEGYLNVAPSFVVDQSENSNMVRYADISELFGDWLDEQGDFWAKKVEYLEEMDSYAKALYAKKG